MVYYMNKFVLSLFILTSLTFCKAANIFCVFPIASYSHQQPLLALSRALAAKGHNLTVITANPSEVPIANHQEIDISFMYELMKEENLEKETGFSTQKRSTAEDTVKKFPTMFDVMYKQIFNSPQIKKLIREVNGTKYDLLIYEWFMPGFLGFSDLIGNPPIISVATLSILQAVDIDFGNPIIPSFIPSLFLPYEHHMTFWQRFYNLYIELYFLYNWHLSVKPTSEKYMRDNFGNVDRKLNELQHNISVVIISSDLSTGYPKPVQPNTFYVGPMHLQAPKPLPKDLQKWLDESEDGVIYFSLGSNMKGTSVPPETRAAFIKAFKQFPKVRVLWKWESDDVLPGQPDNVLVKKWLPQQSVLAHSKVRLFISQVGVQSFGEAIYHGVPVLGLPMFGDQDFNAKKLVQAGAGLSLEFESLTYDMIYETLKELLSNASYKENMLQQSRITKDKPMSAINTAIWWVEYVLRHNGAPHFRPAALDLTWYQYYMLDILSVVLITLFTIFLIIYFIVKKLFNLLLSSQSKSQNLGTKKKTN